MKSEDARALLKLFTTHASDIKIDADADFVLSKAASIAVKQAENEAEDRMRNKAVEAFKSSCRYQEGCLGANMKCDPAQCEDLRLFIQKLEEDEND